MRFTVHPPSTKLIELMNLIPEPIGIEEESNGESWMKMKSVNYILDTSLAENNN
jgi:hypothetical protein